MGDRVSSANCKGGDDGWTADATAFQLKNDGSDFCKRLGGSLDDDEMSFKLLDSDDPSKGLALTYTNGSKCSSGKSRTFTVQFKCANRQASENRVEELPSKCEYVLEYPHVLGCPTECARGLGYNVCSDHGFCGMDTDLKTPACFCDRGFYGTDCSLEGKESNGGSSCDGVCVALAFVLVFLTILLGVTIFTLVKVRKLNDMNIRFHALSESFVPGGDDGFELEDTAH